MESSIEIRHLSPFEHYLSFISCQFVIDAILAYGGIVFCLQAWKRASI